MLDHVMDPMAKAGAFAPFPPPMEPTSHTNAGTGNTSPRIKAPIFPLSWAPMPTRGVSELAALGLVSAVDLDANDGDATMEWSEEDIVFLHWRLLQEVSRLADPATPLEEKFDTLRWVFTEPEKDARPFSFTSCLRVVGCSPLSPVPYCGLVDAEEIRDGIRIHLRTWLRDTLARYPNWVREVVIRNPAWVEARLSRNPQWINEQLKRMSAEGDLFA